MSTLQPPENSSPSSDADSSAQEASATGSYRKWLWSVVAVMLVAAAGVFVWKYTHKPAPKLQSTQPAVRIGLSLDSLKGLRWSHDRDAILAEAAKKGANVTVMVADSNDATQASQIENLVSQKVDVIIVIPHNATALTAAIEDAHKAGIKVISYDRLIENADIDSYVSVNSTTIGKLQAQYVVNAIPPTTKVANVALVDGASTDNNATLLHSGSMSVLQPLVAEGKVKIVLDSFIPDWNTDQAQAAISDYLGHGGRLDAAVVANDSMAGGVVQALTMSGLAGKIPVSGQDSDLPAVRRLVAGTQTVTMYKPVATLGAKAVDIAMQLARHQAADTNTASVTNGKVNVPTYLIEPVAVTKANIDSVLINSGWLSHQDIYGTNSN